MKIVFMGTPDFSVKSLQALIDSPHEVVGVFTRPDKPRDRGKKISYSPVKELALSHGIPVFQPNSFKTRDAFDALAAINPDCVAVAAYGMILPKEVLGLPKYGCVNVHASLLPKYRGAAPINRCIMDRETESGVTIMQMDAGLDTGDMLLWEKVGVNGDMTASRLHDILAETGARLLVKAMAQIGELPRVKQDDSISSYAAMITKEERRLDFSKPAEQVLGKILGLADYPCAYALADGRRLKVYRAVIGGLAGGITVDCEGGEKLTFTEVQPENGRRMRCEEFLKGNSVDVIE